LTAELNSSDDLSEVKPIIAAYDANDRMIKAASADYVTDGTNVIISASGAAYYKAFILGANAKPVVGEKMFN